MTWVSRTFVNKITPEWCLRNQLKCFTSHNNAVIKVVEISGESINDKAIRSVEVIFWMNIETAFVNSNSLKKDVKEIL